MMVGLSDSHYLVKFLIRSCQHRDPSDSPHRTAPVTAASVAGMYRGSQEGCGGEGFRSQQASDNSADATPEVRGGDPVRSFVYFSWCRTAYDQDAVRYAGWRHRLLWMMKNIVPELHLAGSTVHSSVC